MRGTLKERFEDAKKLGLTRIEVPFDLVREENDEYLKLNKKIGDIIAKEDFEKLYGKEKFEHEYILHTDPELKENHILYWNLTEWRTKYFQSIIDFAHFIGKPPFAIEFHPSKPKRSKNMDKAIVEAFDKFKEINNPYILIENRTGMYISTVKDMIKFYETVCENLSPSEIKKFGLCIDISQIYTEQRKDPTNEIAKIPRNYILCWHIHYKHKVPSMQDPINWREITKILKETKAICLPEVFTFNNIIQTIKFIEKMI